MPRPRVTILHYTGLPTIGGVENVIADHTRLLLEAGYPVNIVVGRGGQDPALAGATLHVIPELDSEHPENLRIANALDEGKLLPDFTAFQHRIEQRLMPVLAETDILVGHNVFNFHFNLPLTAALYALVDRGGPRAIAWCHDISRYVNPTSGEPLRYGFPWDLLRTCHPGLTYVAVSARRQQSLAGILGCSPDQIHVIPNGVTPGLLLGLSDWGEQVVRELGLLGADLIILMPVRVTRAKNIELGLQVTAAVKALGLFPRLLVTGPPDPHAPEGQAYFQELLELRRALGLEQEAFFLHQGISTPPAPINVDPARVAELYRICDVVFMPSHREGFGLPILEGALVGRAVFTTDIPAVEEIGLEFFLPIGADELPEAIAARIYAWAEQDPIQRARRRVRSDYTWPIIFAREIEPLLREGESPRKEQR